jgi:predicted DNA-binding transcriptional regulator AlpA
MPAATLEQQTVTLIRDEVSRFLFNLQREFAPPLQLFIRKADLPKYVGLQRTQIQEMIAEGKFPRPVQIGSTDRAIAWLAHEVAAWQMQRTRTGDAAVSKSEDAAKVQLSSRPGPQPIQSGATSRRKAGLKAETHCCLSRMARPRGVDCRWREAVKRHSQVNRCYFDSATKRDVFVDRFNALRETGSLTVVLGGGVRAEVQNPRTPADV